MFGPSYIDHECDRETNGQTDRQTERRVMLCHNATAVQHAVSRAMMIATNDFLRVAISAF